LTSLEEDTPLFFIEILAPFMEDRNMVDDLDDGIMAADNHEIEEDIIRLVEEHGNLDEILLGQQRPQHQQPNPPQAPGGPVPPPDDPMNPLEEWDNVLPADIVDHPVIKAFQEVNANFLVSDPRIAGNPIIYASKVKPPTKTVLLFYFPIVLIPLFPFVHYCRVF
jgi:hypothetical protein